MVFLWGLDFDFKDFFGLIILKRVQKLTKSNMIIVYSTLLINIMDKKNPLLGSGSWYCGFDPPNSLYSLSSLLQYIYYVISYHTPYQKSTKWNDLTLNHFYELHYSDTPIDFHTTIQDIPT